MFFGGLIGQSTRLYTNKKPVVAGTARLKAVNRVFQVVGVFTSIPKYFVG